LISGLGTDIIAEPRSYALMSLLGLLRSSDDTCADSPDWLVCNDDLAPVGDLLADGIELASVDSISLTSFALIKLLSNASHDVEVVFESNFDLLCDDLIGLSEDMASLTVTKDDPAEAEVLQHSSAGFTSVCTVAVKGAVLS